ncbi:hypothetical protein [Botrimarina mediterranea]|uniref:hypothetical protein n=1 Tax=Botrimarina mediterranea TaxID=2528022 RepID=UPI001188B813|nr:hypothetical protein K2D_16540 [Planctomycetes bacterium K2D]
MSVLAKPEEIHFGKGGHYVVVTARADVGWLIEAFVYSPKGKKRFFAETMGDARTIAQLCDRVYGKK